MTDAAYSSNHPDVLAAYDQAVADREAIAAARRAYEAGVGGRRLIVQERGLGHNVVKGVESLDGDPTSFDGFRRYASNWYHSPDRTKAGKLRKAELDALKMPELVLPGLPSMVMTDHRVLSPGLFCHERTLWASWSCAPEHLEDPQVTRHESDRMDLTLWTRRRLSEFYAAQEAHQDQAKGTVDA
jgi:hypothetical protein